MTDQATPIRKTRKPRSAVQLLLTIAAMDQAETFKPFVQLSNDDQFVNADLKAAAESIVSNLEFLVNAGNKIKDLANQAVA
jgi:hypothetical protein